MKNTTFIKINKPAYIVLSRRQLLSMLDTVKDEASKLKLPNTMPRTGVFKLSLSETSNGEIQAQLEP